VKVFGVRKLASALSFEIPAGLKAAEQSCRTPKRPSARAVSRSETGKMENGKWKIQKFAVSACEFPFAWITGFPRLQLF
jgi:hypothetical protein